MTTATADRKFVDCAIAAGADWLVSDDRHILNLLREENRFPPLSICSFADFEIAKPVISV